VEAPAFIRGKERFSAPGGLFRSDMRFSAGGSVYRPFCHSERSEESAVRPSGAPLLTAHHFHQIVQDSETTPFRGQECAAPQLVSRNGSNVRTMRTRFPPRKILGSRSPVGRLISGRRKWCVICVVSYAGWLMFASVGDRRVRKALAGETLRQRAPINRSCCKTAG
jgi:hypothetical protein